VFALRYGKCQEMLSFTARKTMIERASFFETLPLARGLAFFEGCLRSSSMSRISLRMYTELATRQNATNASRFLASRSVRVTSPAKKAAVIQTYFLCIGEL
jgi:hypothetical protein